MTVVGIAFLGSLGNEVLDRVVIQWLINLILVVGLYVFIGNSGVFSFGQISFMAVGAYTAGLLTLSESAGVFITEWPGFLAGTRLPSVPATVVAGLAAAGVAAIIGVPLMRLSGMAASLASFAWLIIVNVVASNWDPVTGGLTGMAGVPITTNRDRVIIWAVLAIIAAAVFQQSKIGLRLRASREDEVAAQSIGVRVHRERWVAFVLSAFFMGVGGALFGQFVGSFNPDAFFLRITFLTIAMLVIGGLTSLSGAVLGTIVISVVTEFLRRVEVHEVGLGPLDTLARPGLQQVGLAVLMVGILLSRPRGLTNGKEIGLYVHAHGKGLDRSFIAFGGRSSRGNTRSAKDAGALPPDTTGERSGPAKEDD